MGLSSFALTYVPGDNYPVTLDIRVQCTSDVQLRGFHIVQPRLRVRLAGREVKSSIEGRAVARYSVVGSEAVGESSTDIIVDERGARMSGECVNVMRMTDVLKQNMEPYTPHSTAISCSNYPLSSAQPSSSSSSSPTELSSYTSLPWTLDSTLARQLPWLTPCNPPALLSVAALAAAQRRAPAGAEWNKLLFLYDWAAHNISQLSFTDLAFGMSDPSSSPSTSFLLVLLSMSRMRANGGFEFIRVQMRDLQYCPPPPQSPIDWRIARSRGQPNAVPSTAAADRHGRSPRPCRIARTSAVQARQRYSGRLDTHWHCFVHRRHSEVWSERTR